LFSVALFNRYYNNYYYYYRGSNYEEVAKLVLINLARIKFLTTEIVESKLNKTQTDDDKQLRSATLDRLVEKCKNSVTILQDKITMCGAVPTSIVDRITRLAKLAAAEL